ncbi:MAG: NAD(P)-dependent oxidoreductase [Lachnospiraceae bacterium]|nr:NAD(P)-dependent oxidoreductase [Lachnospiraceae bacterium]
MRAYITGGSGSIGVALTELLLENGCSVTWFTHPGSKRSLRAARQWTENPSFTYQELSIEEYDRFDEKYPELTESTSGEPGLFFHLAWGGTFGAFRNDPEIQKQNVKGAVSALYLAKKLGCEAFVGAGSQAEYGPVRVPLTSNTPMNPVTEYGKAKKEAGEKIISLGKKQGIRASWCRILSVYGPGDTEGTMVDYAIRTLLTGGEAKFSHGEQIWDYLYSEDAAKALYLTALHAPGGAYVLGSGEARPLKEYIGMIRDAADPEGTVLLGAVPGPEEPYPVLTADLTELTDSTGFRPSFSFEEGIRKTVKWYRDCVFSETIV